MRSRRAWVIFSVKGIVSVALLSALLWQVGIEALFVAVERPSLISLLASGTCLTIYFAANSARWVLVLRAIGHQVAINDAVQITFVSQFFSQFLPTSIGADVLRMWQSAKVGVPAMTAVNGVLLERLSFFLALSIVASILSWTAFYPPLPATYTVGITVVALLALLFASTLLVADRANLLFMPERAMAAIKCLSRDARKLLSSRDGLLLSFAYFIEGQCAFSLVLVMLGAQFDLALSVMQYIAIGPLIVLLGAIPLSIAGWGVREVAMVGLLTHLGASAAQALQLSLAVGGVSLLASLPGAIIWAVGTYGGNQTK